MGNGQRPWQISYCQWHRNVGTGKGRGLEKPCLTWGSLKQRTRLGAVQRAQNSPRKAAQHLPKLASKVTGEDSTSPHLRDFGYYTLWWRNLILLLRSSLFWWVQLPAVHGCLEKAATWTETPDLPRFSMLLASLCLGTLHPKSSRKYMKEHFLCFSASWFPGSEPSRTSLWPLFRGLCPGHPWSTLPSKFSCCECWVQASSLNVVCIHEHSWAIQTPAAVGQRANGSFGMEFLYYTDESAEQSKVLGDEKSHTNAHYY